MVRLYSCLVFLLFVPLWVIGQTGSTSEPVRYIGGEIANPTVHDGGFRYCVGVENIQVLRANRTNPMLADHFGWTYNHAPDITFWNKRFYVQYLSNPVNEHEAPGHTLLVTSEDGRNWSMPEELFPPYRAPEGVSIPDGYNGYMMHQRMGFYTASNGKLLTLAFYGHTEDPFKEGGIGRVVREIHKDGSLGPIYFIRYTSHGKWNEFNTSFPFFQRSKDKAFVQACNELLQNKLKTLQWLDEDRGLDSFYTLKDSINTLQALSYYHRQDGKVVGLWKKSFVTLSDDEGLSWSKPKTMPSLIMAGGKIWGQRTKDGRYALCYNPIETQEYRYPLALVTGPDGVLYDNMGVVHGEVPPRRFYGRWKDFGPNYTRGISEGESTPDGNDMWIVYSVNKEDIWVSRIPIPTLTEVNGDVHDDFDSCKPGGDVPFWNIYSPNWAKIEVMAFPSMENKSLRLSDNDPYDYAKAMRVFQEGTVKQISFRFYAMPSSSGALQMDVADRHGNRTVRLMYGCDGRLTYNDGSHTKPLGIFDAGAWHSIVINLDTNGLGFFNLTVDGEDILSHQQTSETVQSVERILFRTGDYRNLPDRKTPNQVSYPALAGADTPVGENTFFIDDLVVTGAGL